MPLATWKLYHQKVCKSTMFLKNFKEIACINYEIWIFKNHGFPICFVLGWATLPTTIENVWENHDFKSVITHDVHMQSLWNFKGLLYTCKTTDGMTLKLPGTTIKFVHETNKIMNMCHYTTLFSCSMTAAFKSNNIHIQKNWEYLQNNSNDHKQQWEQHCAHAVVTTFNTVTTYIHNCPEAMGGFEVGEFNCVITSSQTCLPHGNYYSCTVILNNTISQWT